MKPKQVAKIAKVSESYVYKVLDGSIQGGDKATAISMLLDLESHLKDIVADERFWDMCETAIAKCRSIETRKFAVRLQHISEIIRNENHQEGE